MLVPIHPPVIGQAGIQQFTKEVKDALIERLQKGIEETQKVTMKKRNGEEYQVDKEVKAHIADKDLADKLDKIITELWISETFGIVPVEDVNVILDQEKQGIADFNSNINDKVNNKSSLLKQHTVTLLFIMGMFVLIVGAAILWPQHGATGAGSAAQALTSAVNATTHATAPPGAAPPSTAP
jgi:hypothetical protein